MRLSWAVKRLNYGQQSALFERLNIEDQWHQLKAHEIAGRMFEDEYDLALAVINGMEARSLKGGYSLERFKFNSA